MSDSSRSNGETSHFNEFGYQTRRKVPMKHTIVNRLSLGFGAILVAAVAGLTATPAKAAEAHSGQPPCSAPQVSQAFLSFNDTGWYALLNGDAADNFDGVGWKLGGGAHIVTTKLIDGHVGRVLDLPSGSVATSPLVCVSSSFTTARAVMRTRSRNNGGGVSVYISSAGSDTRSNPRSLGQLSARGTDWRAADPLSLQSAIRGGWQQVRFALVSHGRRSESQLYRFGLDPRMKRALLTL